MLSVKLDPSPSTSAVGVTYGIQFRHTGSPNDLWGKYNDTYAMRQDAETVMVRRMGSAVEAGQTYEFRLVKITTEVCDE